MPFIVRVKSPIKALFKNNFSNIFSNFSDVSAAIQSNVFMLMVKNVRNNQVTRTESMV